MCKRLRRAARPIDGSFNGVDIRQTDGGSVVREVNDNLKPRARYLTQVWVLATGSGWWHPIDARLTFMERHKFLV
jgi:hypothetical protein